MLIDLTDLNPFLLLWGSEPPPEPLPTGRIRGIFWGTRPPWRRTPDGDWFQFEDTATLFKNAAVLTQTSVLAAVYFTLSTELMASLALVTISISILAKHRHPYLPFMFFALLPFYIVCGLGLLFEKHCVEPTLEAHTLSL